MPSRGSADERAERDAADSGPAGDPDVLAGGGSGRWWDERLAAGSGRGPSRLALDAVRRRPRAAAALAAGALGLGVAIGAPLVAERGRDSDVPPITLPEACTRLIAYRDADTGREWMAALADLRRVVHRHPADETARERAAWTYASAIVGPPTAGPARYLVGADRACRAVGQPLLPNW